VNWRPQQFSECIRGPDDEAYPQVFLIRRYSMLDPFRSNSTHAPSINDSSGW